MKVSIGKEHYLLGSRKIYRDDRIFEIDMSINLSDIVDEFGETPTEVAMPARPGMFEVDLKKIWLMKKKDNFFIA